MKDIIKFTRFYLSLAVSISGVITYFIATKSPHFEIIIAWAGILLLALGLSALNQIQEKKYDILMQRTKTRPYANGTYSFIKALFIVFLLLFISFICLYLSINIYGLYFFVATIIIYNIIYTYLKPRTYFALIFGSFLGVIAPSIGWLLANNLYVYSFLEPKFLYIFTIFFIWQVPHFWLLVLIHENDYKQANLPTLQDKIGKNSITNVIGIWNLLVVANGLMLLGVSSSNTIILTIGVIASVYISYTSYVLVATKKFKIKFFKIKFMEINTYVLLLMILILINNYI